MAKEEVTTSKYVQVEFLSTLDRDNTKSNGVARKRYNYKNKIGAKMYDAVVAPTSYGLSLAVVVGESDKPAAEKPASESYYASSYTPSPASVKELADVVKSSAVDERMMARKKDDLKKKLEVEVKKLDDIQRFEVYAAQSPEFAELLKEFKSL